MLQAMRIFLLLLLLPFCYSASAEIYKWVDQYGNVHFSDSKKDGSQQVELPKGNTYTPPKRVEVPVSPEEEEQAPGYTDMAIVKPEQNETIRSNIGDVSIAINLTPALRPGDSVTLYMDGKELLKGESQTSFSLTGVERGSHTLRATVIGSEGTELISSKSILFHLHKVSVLKRKGGTENKQSTQQNSKRNYNLEPKDPYTPSTPQSSTD
jgi:hypothetical protein